MASKSQAKKKTGAPRPRSQLSFKRSDVTRAIRAARDADMPIGRIEIARTGDIVIVPKSDTAQANNEVEDWVNKHADKG
jgi:hypothetical protein